MASDFPVIDPACIGAYDQGDKLNFIYAALAEIAAGGGGGVGAEEWFTPEQFGAKGDGTTDDTVATQAAADAASAVQGMVLFGSKTYKLTDTITVAASGVRLVGLGWGTQILASGDYGDIFLFDKGVVPTVLSEGIVGGGVYSMYIDSDVARTSGAAIHSKYTHAFEIHSVRLGVEAPLATAADVKLFIGMFLENQSGCDVVGCQTSATSRGAHISGDPLTTGTEYIPFFGYDGRISACDFWGKPYVQDSIGVHIDAGCGGFRLEGNSNVSHFNVGTKIADGVREAFICQSYNDGNWDTGIEVGNCTLCHLDEAWAAANGTHGVGWSVNGYGVNVEGGGDFQITGGRYASNANTSIRINSPSKNNVHVITGVSADSVEFGPGDVDDPGLSYSITGGSISAGVTDIYQVEGVKKIWNVLGVNNVPSTGAFSALSVGSDATSISNLKMGQAVLSGGTVVVTDASVTANTKIFISLNTLGTIAIAAAYDATTRTPGTNFTIKSSSGTDTSTVDYLMIEP